MPITGGTRVFAVIADPIGHVRAPELFNPIFAERGLDAVLVPLHVGAADLPAVWPGLRAWRNLGGIWVTIPHKAAVARLCDEASAAVRQVGAANIVRREPDGRMVCDMFDGAGFVAGLRGRGHEPAGRRALLLGAGGAAAAIAFALAEAGVARLTIANRTAEKAEALAVAVGRAYPDVPVAAGPPDPAGHDLVINATSLGLKPDDPLPVNVARLTPQTTVAEIVMKPETTRLLEEASRIGCPIHHGRHMLDAQVRLMLDFLGL